MRKDFFKVTIRQIKKNLRCARCKKEKCPIRYKHGVTMDGARLTCDVELNERIDKMLKNNKS